MAWPWLIAWLKRLSLLHNVAHGNGRQFTPPGALANWYQEHLGVSLVPKDYEQQPWIQESGPTVFAPFQKETDYFGNSQKVWMVNFRVGNLDKIVAQLRASGIEVKVDPQLYPNGRFARLYDPEGNPIELWEPK